MNGPSVRLGDTVEGRAVGKSGENGKKSRGNPIAFYSAMC